MCWGLYFLFFFLCQIFCIIIFLVNGLFDIRKYFLSLTESYFLSFSNSTNNYQNINNNGSKQNNLIYGNNNCPPKKK